MKTLPLALQLYTVRDHFEKDAVEALKQVKAAGYDYIEGGGLYGMTAGEFRTVVEDIGLKQVSIHASYEETTEHTDVVIERAKIFGVKYVVISWIGGEWTKDPEKWIRHSRALGVAGARFRAAGLQLCYHNHAMEMEEINGKRIIDLVFEMAGSSNLAAQIDTCWAQYGGVDPVGLIRQYEKHCPLLHVKDYVPTAGGIEFKPVGHGCMEWAPIIEVGREIGVAWYIVEQDGWGDLDSMECARLSAEYLARF